VDGGALICECLTVNFLAQLDGDVGLLTFKDEPACAVDAVAGRDD